MKKKILTAVIAIVVAAILVALPIVIPPLYEMATFEEITQGIDAKPEDALRIMTFNVRYSNVGKESREDRVDIVTKTMLDSNADSIGVQEAVPEWMDDFKEILSDKYAYVGVGRDDGDNEGEYSAIFYLKDKYEVEDSGTFWLSETPEKVSVGWDAACTRICTWAVLVNKKTGEKYVHLNSHFDHVGIEARKNSVKLIIEKAKEYTDLPVVFTADMNVKQGSVDYMSLVNSGVLDDTKFIAPDSMDYLTYHDTKPYALQDWIIDYIMINDNLDAISYKVVTEGIDGRYVSDHYPVYAEIKVK